MEETASGLKCQSWAENVGKLSELVGQEVSIEDHEEELELAMCRNPFGAREKPWCYVDESTNGGIDWEFCDDIPNCDDIEVIDGNSDCGSIDVNLVDYRGGKSARAEP